VKAQNVEQAEKYQGDPRMARRKQTIIQIFREIEREVG
jgi:hypothetical protein